MEDNSAHVEPSPPPVPGASPEASSSSGSSGAAASSAPGTHASETSVPLPKSPRRAAFLSLFPGLGNVYNGLYLRGTTFFVVFLAMIQMAGRREELWAPAAMFVWFFNILDSYRQAKLINHGVATDLGLADRPKPAWGGQGSLLAGLAIFLVGLLAFLDIQLGLDMDWVLDFWPVGLMGLGAWFVWSGIRARNEVPPLADDDLLGSSSDG